MAERQQWQSRLGFILAASGSAIGLGNIVFFSANAYRFGAGAFYLPYLLALLCVGIPVMMLEFGLGQRYRGAFPIALGKAAGRAGELAGWFAILNAFVITMYYITILSWAAGMWWFAAAGSLFEASVAVPAFGLEEGALPNPVASFFRLLGSWGGLTLVVLVWAANVLIVQRGTKSIEAAVRYMVPFIWVVMILFIVRGLTLDGGIHGVFLLFEPDFTVMGSGKVWSGAFSQIFFTLSLGFGIMTAYASYMPRRTDHVTNSFIVSLLNCSFELVAGFAIFSLLFAFAVVPQASTLSMMFFIVPTAIDSLGAGARLAGAGFFSLLLVAGISSSISLLEAGVSAVVDRFGVRRGQALAAFTGVGLLGSVCFALPVVVDRALDGNGTLGLSLLDLFDHYAFGYGLLLVGLVECLLVGWVLGADKLRATLNEHSSWPVPLGRGFDILIRFIVPGAIVVVLLFSLLEDLGLRGAAPDAAAGLRVYGDTLPLGPLRLLPWLTPLIWVAFALGGAVLLTRLAAARPLPPDPDATTPAAADAAVDGEADHATHTAPGSTPHA